jgi:threonine dehydrogenase-like Zn-dependent dehydrogenase
VLVPLSRITRGEIDPAFVITHRLPAGYKMFNQKRDGCIKIVLKPDAPADGIPPLE